MKFGTPYAEHSV